MERAWSSDIGCYFGHAAFEKDSAWWPSNPTAFYREPPAKNLHIRQTTAAWRDGARGLEVNPGEVGLPPCQSGAKWKAYPHLICSQERLV